MIEKVYEFVCDNPNCKFGMNYIRGALWQVKIRAKKYGHIIIGNKCYCDQECYNDRNNIPVK